MASYRTSRARLRPHGSPRARSKRGAAGCGPRTPSGPSHLEWRELTILRPRPVLIPHERLARKALRMISERSGSSATTSFSSSGGMARIFPCSRHGLKGHRLSCKHVQQVAHEAPRAEDTHRAARFTREVVDYLHLAFEDDDEVVGQGARPKENLPDLRLPRLPVASLGHQSDLSSALVPSRCGSSSSLSPEIRDSTFRTIFSINADCYALVSGAAYAYSSATNPRNKPSEYSCGCS